MFLISSWPRLISTGDAQARCPCFSSMEAHSALLQAAQSACKLSVIFCSTFAQNIWGKEEKNKIEEMKKIITL